MELSEAKIISVKYCLKIKPYCVDKRLFIAGSIRRMKPDVHDIEIVALPLFDVENDLFGEPIRKVRSKRFIETVNGFGNIIKGNANGKMMQIELPEGIMLDLFIPDDFDYWRQFVIRTGSADYSYKVIATAWKKLGWCGSDKGLRKISDCVAMVGSDGKTKYKCVAPKPELPPVWTSEEHFFQWLKVPFIHPSKRNV